MTKTMKTALMASVMVLAPAAGHAADHHEGDMAKTELVRKAQDGSVTMTGKAISGQEIINADLVDGFSEFGTVDDIVLNDEGAIAFIKYDTTRIRDLDKEGYLAVGSINLEADNTFNVDISTDNITEEGAPQRMELSPEEQEKQLLSSILRSEISMGSALYNVRDAVFAPDGKIEYLIASEGEGGFLQEGDAFAVPFGKLTWSDGAWRTDMKPGDRMVIAYNQ